MQRGWGLRITFILILLLTVGSVYAVWPSEPDRYLPGFIPWPSGQGIHIGSFERRAMNLGLDLRGGTRMVLEAQIPADEERNADDIMASARDIIEKRINAFGVSEPQITRQGTNRLDVQLAGVKPSEAFDKIGRTALLRFCEPLRDADGNVAVVQGGKAIYNSLTCEVLRNPDGSIQTTEGATISYVPRSTVFQQGVPRDAIVWTPGVGDLNGVKTELTGKYLKGKTYVGADQVGKPELRFEFSGDGAKLSEQITGRLQPTSAGNDSLPISFWLDGDPITDANGNIDAPNVISAISNQGRITGMNQDAAQNLSKLVNAGAFPVPLRLVQQQEVDATLGEDAVKASVIAGEVAILIIMLFMIGYYRLPGVLASVALMVYTSLVLAIFKIGPIIGPVTLTLAGVAAFILSVGMAVDANILIFERMKEELRRGRTLRGAIDAGFGRAWPSIRDSNVSTFITCLILYVFGDSFGEALVKGFALTLAIGVAVSMFSAIFVTRTFLHVVLATPLAKNLHLWAPDIPKEELARRAEPAPVRGGSKELD